MLRSVGKQTVESVLKKTRSSAIAEGPRDAPCQFQFRYATTLTTVPDHCNVNAD